MARLSINDLNNLSGVSKESLDELYKCFREAHTIVFNNINEWLYKYSEVIPTLENSHNNIFVYTKARNLYYNGSLLLDSVDLFIEFSKEYQSIVYKLNLNETMSNIRTFVHVIDMKKVEVIKRLSNVYGIYSEAFEELNEEEIYEG